MSLDYDIIRLYNNVWHSRVERRAINIDKIKSALYCRVSTEHDDQLTSYRAQMEFKNEQFDIKKIYNEQVSGKYLYKRKEQQRLLYDAGIDVLFHDKQPIFSISERTPLFDVIIVANTSRFGRNLVEVKQMINALEKKKISVYFDDLGKMSTDTDLSLTLDLLFLLDENYSKQVKQKVAVGMQRCRDRKMLLINGSFFGMTYLPNPENRLVPNEDAPIVKAIFEDYKNGSSCRSLAIKYNKQPHSINDIINNAKYAGLNFYGRYQENGRKRPIHEIEYFETDRIDPIISKELWYECQEIKKSRTIHAGTGKVRGVNNNTYPLSGKIKCAWCGANYYHHSTGKRMGANWRCLTKANKKACSNADINEKRIIQYLKSGFFDMYIEKIKGSIQLVLEQHELLDRTEAESTLLDINSRIKKILDLYLEGSIEKDIYEEKYNLLISDKTRIEETLANIDNYNAFHEEICRKREKYIYELEQMRYDINILDDYESVFKKVSQIIIDKDYDFENDKIFSYVKEIRFKGFEVLSDITKELPFGKL